MFASLKVANGAFAKLANPQVQAVLDNAYEAKVASSTSNKAIIPVPAYQAQVLTPVLSSNKTTNVSSKVSLGFIANSVATDKGFFMPPFTSKANFIVPSFAFKLEPAQSAAPIQNETSFVSSRLEPYENMTGISQERPEVIMLSDFTPLFIDRHYADSSASSNSASDSGVDQTMTDAGLMIDTQIQSRALRYANIVQLLRTLKLQYPNAKEEFGKRHDEFVKQVDRLKGNVDFLLNLVRSLDVLKSQLDVRHGIHKVDTQKVVQGYITKFSKINTLNLTNDLLNQSKKLPQKYSVVDALTELGFKANNVKEFSSTKVWLQLSLELKEMLKTHSLNLIDIEPSAEGRDNNATSITKNTSTRFSLKQQLPDLPALQDIVAIPPTSASSMSYLLEQAWNVLYQDVHFKTIEARIAALINLFSKEFRYSNGLSQQSVQRTLSEQFSYSVQPVGNLTVFDNVIGQFGNNIGDVPVQQTNSLSNIAQRKISDSVVLTFESKYLEGDTGLLTPGSVHYVDQVMKTDGLSFDTSRIDELAALLDNTYNRLGVVADGLNLTGAAVVDPNDKSSSAFASVLSNPSELTKQLLKQLIDVQTGTTIQNIQNDNLAAFYTFATTNKKVKSDLFMLTMAKISRTYHNTIPFLNPNQADNTPLSDALAESIVSTVEANVQNTSTIQKKGTLVSTKNTQIVQITRDSAKSILKQGTYLSTVVEKTMQQVLAMYRKNDSGMINGRTRYSGYLDTVVMMTVFDALIELIAKYCNFKVMSVGTVKNKFNSITTFSLVRGTVNHKISATSLLQKLDSESRASQMALYVMLNTLQKLSNALRMQSSYLKNDSTINRLKDVSQIIGDQTLLQMAMSEQQIVMQSASVYDIHERLTAQPGESVDGQFDADNDFKQLEDAVVFPKLKNAILGFFGTDRFLSKQGVNKKIMSIGIPLGFSQKLKMKANIRDLNSDVLSDKQIDVIKVCVYKVDLQNSDIVYQPKKFLFELSRFPVRNDKHYLPLSERPTIQEIVRNIPTRDLGRGNVASGGVEYYPSSGFAIPDGYRAAFTHDSYDFLSADEKFEIAHNHVVSYLLELYVRLMTGISLADHHFSVAEAPRPADEALMKFLTEHVVSLLANTVNSANNVPNGGVLFTSTAPSIRNVVNSSFAKAPVLSNAFGKPSNVSKTVQFKKIPSALSVQKSVEQQGIIGGINTNLSAISYKQMPLALHSLTTISNASQVTMPLSDPGAVAKRALIPKTFDRVLNVAIDPDEFEIDYASTMSTPTGKSVFQKLLLDGSIVPVSDNERTTTSAAPAEQFKNANFRMRNRDKDEGDLTFEKYFVTIETYGGETI